MDSASTPSATPTLFSQSTVPFTVQMGDSCFGLRQIEEDSVQHTQLSIYHEEGKPATLIQAEGSVVAVSVEPIPTDDGSGAYIGMLTRCQDDVFLVSLMIESPDGVLHEQRTVVLDVDDRDDLVLRYDHNGNCAFITSNRQNGTIARIDTIRKGVAT